MLTRSYNPVEGGPAIWIDAPIAPGAQVPRLLRQLREWPADREMVDVVLDTAGGDCATGLALYCALRDDPRRKRVTIYRALSMGAVIAMAGDEIRIAGSGIVGLHGAGLPTERLLNEMPGRHMTAPALRALARGCEATDALHIAIFSRRTGLPLDRVAELRAAETILNAEAAVRLGFADSIIRRQEA